MIDFFPIRIVMCSATRFLCEKLVPHLYIHLGKILWNFSWITLFTQNILHIPFYPKDNNIKLIRILSQPWLSMSLYLSSHFIVISFILYLIYLQFSFDVVWQWSCFYIMFQNGYRKKWLYKEILKCFGELNLSP